MSKKVLKPTNEGNNANLLLPAVFPTSFKPKLADKLHHGFQKHSVEIEICFEGSVDLETKTYQEDWFEIGFYSYDTDSWYTKEGDTKFIGRGNTTNFKWWRYLTNK